MFEKLSVAETRNKCKETLESLEFWLRRIVDQILTEAYGVDYLCYKSKSGSFLIKRELRENVKRRLKEHPERYSSKIDATLLDDLIYIVCRPDLYSKHFRSVFSYMFPDGVYELRTFLSRLIEPRNSLAHTNPINTHQAEQVICYSKDIIISVKEFYKRKGMQAEYNVPLILQINDSFGNKTTRENFSFLGSVSFKERSDYYLHPGDTLSIEVEIDPSFDDSEYKVEWAVVGKKTLNKENQKRFDLKIENKHVGEQLSIECCVTSYKDWHAKRYCDDRVSLYYKVLPPQ